MEEVGERGGQVMMIKIGKDSLRFGMDRNMRNE